jgi:V/A-type H+-transporting ATPase subunit D
MIQPTRTNLLLLKERVRTLAGSVEILKTKRQALIREFLSTSAPFLKTRRDIRQVYGRAIRELHLAVGGEGRHTVAAIARGIPKEPTVDMGEGRIWGISYRDVQVRQTAAKAPPERDYDFRSTTPHLEEAAHRFETVVDAVVQMAAYESKLKRLGEEISRTTRRMRVLEERVLPRIRARVRSISQYIEERDREAYCRLKRVKESLRVENRWGRPSAAPPHGGQSVPGRESGHALQ